MTFDQLEKEFGPERATAIRKLLRQADLPAVLAWLFTKDFRSSHSVYKDFPGTSPGDCALVREGEATGAKRVLDFFASVIGEEVKLPTPPFRQTK
jgi:hypothetical protein